MKITVCIGSSCHLKGSQQVVEQLKTLAEQLDDDVELCGAFCTGNCTNGVSVIVNDELFSVQPDDVKQFFTVEVLSRLNSEIRK